jgi:hypothetical protein
MHVEYYKNLKISVFAKYGETVKKKICYCTLVVIEIKFIMHVELLIILVKLQFKHILHVFL